MIKAYLAGPGIFRKDATERYAAFQAICLNYGIIALSPLDNQYPEAETPREKAHAIFRADRAQMDACDIVIADMSEFRGPSMDVGTAFEIGYCYAQGKTIYGYSSNLDPYTTKVHHHGIDPEANNETIEDFGLTDNLMVIFSVKEIHSTFKEAVMAACVDILHGMFVEGGSHGLPATPVSTPGETL